MGISKIGFILTILFIIIMIIFIRKQILIDDKQFLQGMVPHHSMAILMSKKIKNKTKNPRIQRLASQIIRSQANEINIMNDILKENEKNKRNKSQ